jgi:hypothetical protein
VLAHPYTLEIGSESPPGGPWSDVFGDPGHAAFKLRDNLSGTDSGWLGLTPNTTQMFSGHFGVEPYFAPDVSHTITLSASQYQGVVDYINNMNAQNRATGGKIPYFIPVNDCINTVDGAVRASGHMLPGLNLTQPQLQNTLRFLNQFPGQSGWRELTK